MKLSRRSALRAGAGALALGALAGCLSEPDGGDDPDDGYAAFFALWDWTEQVTGDESDVENPVDVGEMGHGWEPPADLQREIADSAFFVYLDTDEFTWAQDVAADLETDYDHLTLIDGMNGIEDQLLAVDRGDLDREPADAGEFDPETVEVGGFDVYDRRSGNEAAYWHDGHWHGGIPEIPEDGTVEIEGVFEDDDGRVLPLGDDEPFQIDASVVDGANEDVIGIESRGDHVLIHGRETGRTRIVLELVAGDEVIWDTSSDSMSAVVVEEVEDSEAPDFYDPHVWVDPIIAQDIVEIIADGLAEMDPDSEDLYRENAAAYAEELDDVDRQFRELTDDASRDVAVFAGHDSFQYLEHRYDFELHTPVGVSPDAVESSDDISELIGIVEEHDIDTILYDPFETANPDEDVPEMVDVLLEETEATEYAPLTPAEGTIEEWADRGYGWVEQMTEINVPSLEKALGAN